MRSRRIAAVAVAVAAGLTTGVVTAGAAPADRPGVPVAREQHARARAAVDPVASTFVPIAPRRVLDTRVTGAPVGQARSVVLDLSAQTPADATSVVLNVTGVSPTLSTFVTVYPTGEARPIASNLNLAPGKIRANAVVVALSADREVTLYNNSGSTHLVVDLAGYYVAGEAKSLFNPTNPRRVLDTRSSAPVGAGRTVNVNLSSLPASATAVTFNLTGLGATLSTFITAYPAGQARPIASNVNLPRGEIVPNQVTVQIGASRSITLYNNSGSAHLVVDVVGYYDSGAGYPFVAFTPERAWDSRVTGPGLQPSYFVGLTGWGEETDPAAIMGVAGNLTGVNASAAQFVSVWPGGQPKPNASSLNVVRGQIVANAVTVGVGYEPTQGIQDRSINFANNAGYIDVIFDVAGIFVKFNDA
jgi:hypothetical protein